MPSDKVKMILLDSTNLSEDYINDLTDAQGWGIIYSDQQKKRRPKDIREQICFTGFRPFEREELFGQAEVANMRTVQSVTKNLTYLCTGPNTGPKKLEKANSQDVKILSKDEFLKLVSTGEIKK